MQVMMMKKEKRRRGVKVLQRRKSRGVTVPSTAQLL
jgi:hypothetical protein